MLGQYGATCFFLLFFFIIDKTQQQNTELLQCVSSLSHAKSFATFDVNKLLSMIEFYPNYFIDVPKVALHTQLKNYVTYVRSDRKFAKLEELSDFCATHLLWYVYKLLKLALLLQIATASVEHVFSDMKVVKSNLCNKTGDQWLNVSLVTYI